MNAALLLVATLSMSSAARMDSAIGAQKLTGSHGGVYDAKQKLYLHSDGG